MTPETPVGWILFSVMWLAGPITGYTASGLIASAWERRAVERRDVTVAGLSGSLLAIATLSLMFVAGL